MVKPSLPRTDCTDMYQNLRVRTTHSKHVARPRPCASLEPAWHDRRIHALPFPVSILGHVCTRVRRPPLWRCERRRASLDRFHFRARIAVATPAAEAAKDVRFVNNVSISDFASNHRGVFRSRASSVDPPAQIRTVHLEIRRDQRLLQTQPWQT